MKRPGGKNGTPPKLFFNEETHAKKIFDQIKKDGPISDSAKEARIRILKSLVRLGAVLDVTSHKKMLDPKAVVIVSGFPVHMGSGGGLVFFLAFFLSAGTRNLPKWNSR